MALVKNITDCVQSNFWKFKSFDFFDKRDYINIAITKRTWDEISCQLLSTSMVYEERPWVNVCKDVEGCFLGHDYDNIVIFKFNTRGWSDYLKCAYTDNQRFIIDYCNGTNNHLTSAESYRYDNDHILKEILYARRHGEYLKEEVKE